MKVCSDCGLKRISQLACHNCLGSNPPPFYSYRMNDKLILLPKDLKEILISFTTHISGQKNYLNKGKIKLESSALIQEILRLCDF